MGRRRQMNEALPKKGRIDSSTEAFHSNQSGGPERPVLSLRWEWQAVREIARQYASQQKSWLGMRLRPRAVCVPPQKLGDKDLNLD